MINNLSAVQSHQLIVWHAELWAFSKCVLILILVVSDFLTWTCRDEVNRKIYCVSDCKQELYLTHQYWWFSVPILNYIFTIYIIVYSIYRVYKRQMSCFGKGPFFLPSFSSPPFPSFTVFSNFLLPSLLFLLFFPPKKPDNWSRALYAPSGWPGM